MNDLFVHNPMLAIISHIFFIGLTFFALQSIMPEKIIKKHHVFQAQLLYILLSFAIGSAVSNFFLDISYWSGRLPIMFK
ncbi:DUF1146 family protein [Sporosarcina oncorhynchi]|uniref:DUF1146 family protein n=1 Tax=Sporosarcina oncorhynchi TaxID=3056444 RepID=A0ABZ0L7G2_9BACL|nr:DUF1146 family protein [Sporosarcina sp. T2O-4]WOV88008.1 DUF1146 family protein [Sporosarcina sp. T2O-4]